MKTAKNILLFFITIYFILITTGCASRIAVQDGVTTTVVLIRHAEKTAITKVLTDSGKRRAKALPEAVSDLDIAAIYSPNLVRNIDTVKPLADQRKLDITVIEDNPDWEAVTHRLVSDHPGNITITNEIRGIVNNARFP
ncbi:MAG: histidine phosphatase family protein [Candidatus Thiodiazotropha endolucinida]